MGKMTENKRDLSFDYIKGLLIFLVVLGHIIQLKYPESYLNNACFIWIYSFHMPMFIAISGHFARKTINSSFKECLLQKGRRLLVPAVVWTIIGFSIKLVTGDYDNITKALTMSARGVWFLYCLFFITMLATILSKIRNFTFCATLLAIIFIIVYPYNPINAFKSFQITRQWPEFLIGLLLFDRILVWNYRKEKKKLKIGVVILSVAAILYSLWFYKAAIINDVNYMFDQKTYLLRIVVQILSTILFFNIFYFVTKQIRRPIEMLNTIGGATMGIYLVHKYFAIPMTSYFNGGGLWSALVAIIVTFISLLFVIIVRKNKISSFVLFGE